MKLILFFISLMLLSPFAWGEGYEFHENTDLIPYFKKIEALGKQLDDNSISSSEFPQISEEARKISSLSSECEKVLEHEKQTIIGLLEGFGEKLDGEVKLISDQRSQLEKSKKNVESKLVICKTLGSYSAKLSERVSILKKEKKNSGLLQRTEPYKTIAYLSHQPLEITQVAKQIYQHVTKNYHWVVLGASLLLMLVLVRNPLQSNNKRCILFYAVALGLMVMLFVASRASTEFSYAIDILVFVVLFWVTHHFLVASAISHKNNENLPKRSWVTFPFLITGTALLWLNQFSTVTDASTILELFTSITLLLLGILFLSLIYSYKKYIIRIGKPYFIFIMLLLSIATIATLAGYNNLSFFILENTFLSIPIVLLGLEILSLNKNINTEEVQGLNHSFLSKAKNIIIENIWIRFAITLFAITALLLLLLRAWGVFDYSDKHLISSIASDIQLGNITFNIFKVVLGILAGIVLIYLSRIIKDYLSESWVAQMQLSQGAKDAIITITGYVGVIASLLIGLSISGIELANLAIILGALSVGIGFGLQNIFNNFISGLILLFERPISRGDLIKVGASQGYVTHISIRSTTLKTFEASDIIVPNSEIISSQVTNLMLDDSYTRLTVKVGVAYGSDTQRVIDELQKVASSHPEVIDNEEMKTRVFFIEFGDSSLNFELRCFVDSVEKKLPVLSDLNLAIDQAFREADIEIPFPHRTVTFNEALESK